MAHYGQPVYGGKPVYGGRQAATVAYHATVERYSVASNEEVVSLGGGYPTTFRRPLSSTHVQPEDYSPKFSHDNNGSPRNYSPKFTGSPRDSPRKGFQRAHSPPPEHYSGTYAPKLTSGSPHDSPRKDFRGVFGRAEDDSSSDDNVECRDGVCYPNPKHGGGNYHQPRKDSSPPNHHQTSDLHNYYNTATARDQKPPEGNNNSYTHTKPVTDPYYAKNDHYNGKSSNGKLPAPIKTKATEHYRDGKNAPVSAAPQWTTFAAPQRKDRKEVIDSTEAQRRYGNAPPQSGTDHKNRATIDSQTAAKRYGGVFVK